jgi:hypothetical protein
MFFGVGNLSAKWKRPIPVSVSGNSTSTMETGPRQDSVFFGLCDSPNIAKLSPCGQN